MFLSEGTEISKEFTPIYAWWASALVLNLLCFAWFTGRIRVRTETIHSDEDRMWMKNPTLCTTGGGHPAVDHIRAGHFKDLMLIMPYLMTSLVWLNTSPSTISASILLRAFPISKIIHSILYMELVQAPKMVMTLSLAICYAVLIYMSIANVYLSYA